MKKALITIFALFTTVTVAFSQTIAADFTAVDCDGTSHTLSNELKGGKVIVLVWVMPCARCINDARGAYEAVKSFEATHPGKVLYYLADDNGGTGCTTLKSWANTNGIKDNVIFFRNEGLAINEDNYGGTGMPHVVVIGPDQNIYFNARDESGNQSAIESAISLAITKTSVKEINKSNTNLLIYPNPAKDQLIINFKPTSHSDGKIEIYNALGKSVLEKSIELENSGEQQEGIDISLLANGIYFLSLHTGNTVWQSHFVVAK